MALLTAAAARFCHQAFVRRGADGVQLPGVLRLAHGSNAPSLRTSASPLPYSMAIPRVSRLDDATGACGRLRFRLP